MIEIVTQTFGQSPSRPEPIGKQRTILRTGTFLPHVDRLRILFQVLSPVLVRR